MVHLGNSHSLTKDLFSKIFWSIASTPQSKLLVPNAHCYLSSLIYYLKNNCPPHRFKPFFVVNLLFLTFPRCSPSLACHSSSSIHFSFLLAFHPPLFFTFNFILSFLIVAPYYYLLSYHHSLDWSIVPFQCPNIFPPNLDIFNPKLSFQFNFFVKTLGWTHHGMLMSHPKMSLKHCFKTWCWQPWCDVLF
jgi:hypothetical protein